MCARITVLDGGFSTQLQKHVPERIDGDPLWTARHLQTHPEAVVRTHLDFLEAGAEVITTNTFQASIPGFQKYLELSEEDSYNLIVKAVQLAQEARAKFCKENPDVPQPRIAGSVGPYGAFLHNGSEYTGSYAKSTPVEELKAFHKPRLQALVEGGVDILALETIPCKNEAEVLLELIKEHPNTKAWLCCSCNKNGKTTACGEDFKETITECYDSNPEQLIALGANCFSPLIVESLFGEINKDRQENPVPFVIYPNSGEEYDAKLGWRDVNHCKPLEYYVEDWIKLGITYIGGCCRTGAKEIQQIKEKVLKI